MQSKQQRGSPFLLAFLVPGWQLSLHTDFGTLGQNKLDLQLTGVVQENHLLT